MVRSWQGNCVACGSPQASYHLCLSGERFAVTLNCPACELFVTALRLKERCGIRCPQCREALAVRRVGWQRGGYVSYYACEACGYVLSEALANVVDALLQLGGENRMVDRRVVEECLQEVRRLIAELRAPQKRNGDSDATHALQLADRLYWLKHIEGILSWLLERGEVALSDEPLATPYELRPQRPSWWGQMVLRVQRMGEALARLFRFLLTV